MAQTYAIRGIGSKGVSVDVPPSELGYEFFNYAENIYIHDLKVKNVPDVELLIGGDHGNILWFSYLYDETTREPVIVYVTRTGTTDTIHQIKAGVDTDISRVSPAYTDITPDPYARWNGFVQNGQVILTNGANVPQYLALGATDFVDMPGWNTAWSCKVIQPFRGAWVALNINDSSADPEKERQATVLRWSSPIADYGSPPATWAELDEFDQPTGAGFNALGETPGEIVTGKTLRDAFMIYKTDSVVRMDYTGNPDAPFSFRTVFEDTGAWGPHAVCSVRNEHFVVGQNDVYITDGFQKQSVIDGRVKDVFDKMVFSTTKAHDVMVVPHYGNEEIFVLIRTKNSNGSLTTQVLCYAYKQDQWFFRAFNESDAVSFDYITYAGTGALSLSAPVVFDRWDDPDQMTWDEGADVVTEQWDNSSTILSVSYIMFAIGGEFYTYGPYRNSTTGLNCVIHKHDMDFNQVAGTLSDKIKRVLRLYPVVDPESRGYILFKLWGHDRPGQIVDEADKKWYLFDIEKDHKVDVTVSGRYISMEISTSTTLLTDWNNYDFLNNPTLPVRNPDNVLALTGIDIDLVALQRR